MNPQSNDVEQADVNTASLPPVHELTEIPELDSTGVSRSGSERHLVSNDNVSIAIDESGGNLSGSGPGPPRLGSGAEMTGLRHRNNSGHTHGSNEIDEIRLAGDSPPAKQYSKRPTNLAHGLSNFHHHLRQPPTLPNQQIIKANQDKRGLKVPLRRMTEQDNVEQDGRVESEPETEAEEPVPVVEETPVIKTPLWKCLSQRTNSRLPDGSKANNSGFLSRWHKNKDRDEDGTPGFPAAQSSFKTPSLASAAFKQPRQLSQTVRDLMEKEAKNYKPPTLEEQSRHGLTRSDRRAVADDDEPMEKSFSVKAAWPYFFAFCVIFLALFDNMALLVLQVFRTEGDWLCQGTLPAEINHVNLNLMIVILCYHSLVLTNFIFTKSWTSLTTRIFGLAANGGHGAYTVVLFFSIVLLITHCQLCAAHTNGSLDFCTMSSTYRMFRRLHLLTHLFRGMVAIDSCFMLKQDITRRLQTAVSSNKRRYIDSEMKLDLDLTYICDRVIAMALPCVAGAMYRNDIREVARFFAMHHYGRFKIFNLCESYEEKGNGNYDRLLLFNQVERIPQRDHHICPLRIFVSFMEHACCYLDLDDANVVAIHCLGGKGRTGAFVCGLMMWTGMFHRASDAMSYYAGRRTDRARGKKRVQSVSAPAQIRYLFYLQAVLRWDFNYLQAHRRIMTRVEMHDAAFKHLKGGAITVVLESPLGIEYDHVKAHRVQKLGEMETREEGDDKWVRTFEIGEVLVGHDISVRFFYFDDKVNLNTILGMPGEICPGGKGVRYNGHFVAKRLMEITFHTAFHDREKLEFGVDEIDGAHNNHVLRKHSPGFKVVLHFAPEPGSGSGGGPSKNSSPALDSLHPRRAMLDQHQPGFPGFSATGSGTGSNFFSNSMSTMALESEPPSEPHTPRNNNGPPSPPALEAIQSGLPLENLSEVSSRQGQAGGLSSSADRLGCALGCLPHEDYLPFIFPEDLSQGARRAVLRRNLLYKVFGRCGAPIKMFQRGEVISADSEEENWPDSTGRTVFLIVKGTVVVSKTSSDQDDKNPFSDSWIMGEGELIGIREFLLGMDKGMSGLVAKAKTDRVVVRHLTAKRDETEGWGIQQILDTIEGTPNKDPNKTVDDSNSSDNDAPSGVVAGGDPSAGVARAQARKGSGGSLGRSISDASSVSRNDLFPFGIGSVQPPPLAFENFGPADVYILYEELLFELALRSHSLEKLEMAIAVQNYELKVASEISTGQADKLNLIRSVRAKFDIPLMEGCAMSLLASMARDGTKEVGDDQFLGAAQGRILIFSQRVCFTDTSKDCQIMVGDILSATANGDVMVIELIRKNDVPNGLGEEGATREMSAHSTDGFTTWSQSGKRPVLRSKKRSFRRGSRPRSPFGSQSLQSRESTDSESAAAAAGGGVGRGSVGALPLHGQSAERGSLEQGSLKSVLRRNSAPFSALSQNRLPDSVTSDKSGGTAERASKLPQMSFPSTFSSNEKLVGTGVRNTAVVGGVRAVFKRETSDESGQMEVLYQFKFQDQPKCHAACNLITRLVRGNSMFSVPARPELPRMSMPIMVGDGGGFTPSEIVELFNYVSPREVVSTETIKDLEDLFQQAIEQTAIWYLKGQVVAKYGDSDMGVLHVLHGCLAIRSGQDGQKQQGNSILRRGRGSVMCERFLHATGNGGLDYTVNAEEDTLCIFVKMETMEGLAARNPEAACTLFARVYRAMAVLVAKRDQQLLMDLYIGSIQKA